MDKCALCGADESARPAHGITDVGLCECCRYDAVHRPLVVDQSKFSGLLTARGTGINEIAECEPPKPDGQEIDGGLL